MGVSKHENLSFSISSHHLNVFLKKHDGTGHTYLLKQSGYGYV